MHIVAGEYGHMDGRQRWQNHVLEFFSTFANRPGCAGCFEDPSVEKYP
jgi:hypothetical protein